MSRRRPVSLRCAHEGCGEVGYYEVETKAEDVRLRSKPYYCIRHRKPEEVLMPANPLRERVLEVYELPYGKFWRTAGSEEGGSGFTHGPGFKAFAADFPVGTRLIVTAKIDN